MALGACDKTLPGLAMALVRLDLPCILLYGGTIMPGRYRGRDVDILSVYEAIGATIAGRMSAGRPQGTGGRGLPRRRAPAAASIPPTPWPR